MKTHLKAITYIITGVLLFTAFILTGSYGLSADDQRIYKQALELQDFVDNFGFSGFRLLDYPVAVYTGDKDFVMQGDNISSRSPMLGILAGTIQQVDDHYEIFIPTYRDMSNTFSTITIVSGRLFQYEDANHVAIIWHEAFHAWQMTFHIERIFSHLETSGQGMDLTAEINKLDENIAYRQLFMTELKMLDRAFQADNGYERQNALTEWVKVVEQYGLTLPPGQKEAVIWHELVEGTAFYVESRIFGQLDPSNYEEYYLSLSEEYANGTSKYYHSGMLKCLLLDQLTPGWQKEFSGDKSLDTLLINAIS